MAPILYHMSLSPPVRAVLLTAKAIGLELEIRETNLMTGDHLKPEYVKMNPQHTIPTLDDDGFIIWDSHAICTYLVSKYGKDDSLYPKDLKKRAIIDQRLHFDSGMMFCRMRNIFFPLFMRISNKIEQEKIEEMNESLEIMEKLITHDWLAGDHMTLADLCCVPVVSSLDTTLNLIKPERFPKVAAWYKRCQQLPYYEECNGTGAKRIGEAIKRRLE